MAKYFVSGVYKNKEGVVVNLLLHVATNDQMFIGQIASTSDIIALIEANNTVQIVIWDYSKGSWVRGDFVKIVNNNSGKYLRSHKNDTPNDNLDNLIRMEPIK